MNTEKDRRERLDRFVAAAMCHLHPGDYSGNSAYSVEVAETANAVLAELERREKKQERTEPVYNSMIRLQNQITDGSGQALLSELATLRETATRRLELLRKCEWHELQCPICFSDYNARHKPDCPLAKELEVEK